MPEPFIQLRNASKWHRLRKAGERNLKHFFRGMLHQPPEEAVVHALQDVSLSVGPGESLGVLGPNGAGKSSLLRVIAGIAPLSEGEVETRGRILPLLELGAGFHPNLSGYENIFLQGALFGIPRQTLRERIPAIVAFAEIEDFIHMPVKHYSSGMQLRLGYAIATQFQPDILLVDEGFAVGDQHFQEKCYQHMQGFHEAGKSFIVVSHDTDLLARVCQKMVWMEQGRVRKIGRVEDVIREYKDQTLNHLFPKPIPILDIKQFLNSRQGRFGSGDALIEKVCFLDCEGRPTYTLTHGKPATIRVYYRLQSDCPEGLDCVWILITPRGHDVAAIPSYEMGSPFPAFWDGGYFDFHIPRLDLTPGQYRGHVSLCRGGDHTTNGIYDIHMHYHSFSVKPDPRLSIHGAYSPPCTWEHA